MSIQFVKSANDFDHYISTNKYLVANFTASWCGPCQAVKPIVDKLYSDPNGRYEQIEIVRVDLDSQRELAARYNVSSIPTFISFESGKEINRINGANVPELIKQLDALAAKASNDPSAGRAKHGESGNKVDSNRFYNEVSNLIPKGFAVLNDSIYYGQFEALNALPLFKNDGDVKNLFRLDYTKESTVLSDADSQLLFYVPLNNISKVFSILLKFKEGKHVKLEAELELDEGDLINETQTPSLIKVWANHHSILSFDDASNDSNAPHIESIQQTEDWYECKLKFVRFQNVQSLNIMIDGEDEDFHTLIDKIIIIGVNGESKEQAKIQKLDDE